MEEKENILNETIMECPLQFSVGGRCFCIHPKSFGLALYLDRLKARLEIDEDNARTNPTLEMLRACERKREVALRIIASSVLRDKDKIFNPQKVQRLMDFFSENLSSDEMATLLTYILRDEHDITKILMGHFKINEELRMKRELGKQRGGNTLTFGGKTVFGTLFDYIAHRYGWTLRQIVWETSYNNLMMMYYDQVDSVYVSKEEQKGLSTSLKMRMSDDGEVIKATKENMDYIKSQNWK